MVEGRQLVVIYFKQGTANDRYITLPYVGTLHDDF